MGIPGFNHREAPWEVYPALNTERGTLVGIPGLNHPERHPGGYTRLYTPERHPGGYITPIIYLRGTLVGIYVSLPYPEVYPGCVQGGMYPEVYPGVYRVVYTSPICLPAYHGGYTPLPYASLPIHPGYTMLYHGPRCTSCTARSSGAVPETEPWAQRRETPWVRALVRVKVDNPVR